MFYLSEDEIYNPEGDGYLHLHKKYETIHKSYDRNKSITDYWKSLQDWAYPLLKSSNLYF